MRYDDFRRSDNVEDRRGGGGGGGGVPGGPAGLGIGGILIVGLLSYFTGINPAVLLSGYEAVTGSGQGQVQQQRRPTGQQGRPTDQMGDFVAATLGSTEDAWQKIFQEAGRRYQAPGLIMFDRVTSSACGTAQSAMGPFYCPTDRKVYLDTSFFQELTTRFRGCSGDAKACQFSYAYVIAHEVGHHVQNSMGILTRVREAQQAAGDERQSNALQVRVELQADCFAGVWAYHTQQQYRFIDDADVRAAMQTAAAIGDDMLQRRSQGRVVPDSFTHGSSEQRQRWFTTGLRSGQISACNTFQSNQL
ncbi:metalloprotease [Phreatobacter aquaticus]|uniref:Metalloprotease n=1 Tax=Phreatobacter aquaticus TaxID=2570229 RepID=A0A4D7QCZ1_9HYPH|nr:neutral zinc metallopeptidase [Phreatobacter aquaticus]QCK85870.1 metalloprotease [Phreatobacter aquaticus]